MYYSGGVVQLSVVLAVRAPNGNRKVVRSMPTLGTTRSCVPGKGTLRLYSHNGSKQSTRCGGPV